MVYKFIVVGSFALINFNSLYGSAITNLNELENLSAVSTYNELALKNIIHTFSHENLSEKSLADLLQECEKLPEKNYTSIIDYLLKISLELSIKNKGRNCDLYLVKWYVSERKNPEHIKRAIALMNVDEKKSLKAGLDASNKHNEELMSLLNTHINFSQFLEVNVAETIIHSF